MGGVKQEAVQAECTGQGVAPRIKWFMVGYVSAVHLLGLWGMYRAFYSPWSTLAIGALAYWLGGLGITAGAHRLWSHRSYKARLPLRFFLAFCNCIANQGSVIRWSRDHRTHHARSETEADPHNASRGFFFAHVGWLLYEKNRHVLEAGKKISLKDLQSDPLLRFQHRYEHWLMIFFCFVFPSTLCMLMGDTYWNGLLVAGFFRYMIFLNATWLVNSAAHMETAFGARRPYNKLIGPVENWLVSVAAIGEGWHNYHHAYPYDYAASEWGMFSGALKFQWNPTKAFIDAMEILGLAYDRRRAKVRYADADKEELKHATKVE